MKSAEKHKGTNQKKSQKNGGTTLKQGKRPHKSKNKNNSFKKMTFLLCVVGFDFLFFEGFCLCVFACVFCLFFCVRTIQNTKQTNERNTKKRCKNMGFVPNCCKTRLW